MMPACYRVFDDAGMLHVLNDAGMLHVLNDAGMLLCADTVPAVL